MLKYSNFFLLFLFVHFLNGLDQIIMAVNKWMSGFNCHYSATFAFFVAATQVAAKWLIRVQHTNQPQKMSGSFIVDNLTLWTPEDGLPTLRKLPTLLGVCWPTARYMNAPAGRRLTDGTVYERSGW